MVIFSVIVVRIFGLGIIGLLFENFQIMICVKSFSFIVFDGAMF